MPLPAKLWNISYCLKPKALLSLGFYLLIGSAFASPEQGLTKVGEAKLSVLFWDVYQSSLYTDSGQYHSHARPIALKLSYLMDIEAQELLKSTQQEWHKLGLKPSQYKPWLTLLAEIFPEVTAGDTIVLLVNQQNISEFYFNQVLIGKIPDPQFGPSFLRIWLDKNSRYPKVRNRLIGKIK
ncbi:chalcone isomerase family protein [Paraglaciecola aestuariivivens]